MPKNIEILATVFFAISILHTFSIKTFRHIATLYHHKPALGNLFHLLSEVEVIFGVWAGVFISFSMFMCGAVPTINYLENLNFTEPMFVFVTMAVAGTKPVLVACEAALKLISKFIPLPPVFGKYITILSLGTLLGSFITEPAAMTVSAILIKNLIMDKQISERLKYATLATLFVNISVGGLLTHFAAPPVLMVASAWSWDTPFMFKTFGLKAMATVAINTLLVCFIFKKELRPLKTKPTVNHQKSSFLLSMMHIGFLVGIILTAHHPVLFIGLFLFFLGLASITSEYQDEIKLKESLLVAFFLGGLVVLGRLQKWWLMPLLENVNELTLYLGAAGLTAVLDNAALTYLGTQVPTLTDSMKYFLVAGAISGGGLSVIANAPNPIGFSILQDSFKEGISPLRLLKSALLPTTVALTCFYFI